MTISLKPKVQEISLAFNPANKRRFILHKDEKGGDDMSENVSNILKKDASPGEAAFMQFLKEQKVDSDASEALCSAYRLLELSKDSLPGGFQAKLHKSFPEILELFGVPKDMKKDRAEIEKEVKAAVEKDIREAVEKEMKMTKDEEVVVLQKDIEVLQKELQANKDALAVEKDARRSMELRKEIEGFGVPGDIGKMAKDVLDAEKANPELGERILASFKEMGTAFKASSDMFKEFGSSGAGEDTNSVSSKISKLVKDKMIANADLQELEARRLVMKENPALYSEYNKDHFRRIREAS